MHLWDAFMKNIYLILKYLDPIALSGPAGPSGPTWNWEILELPLLSLRHSLQEAQVESPPTHHPPENNRTAVYLEDNLSRLLPAGQCEKALT